MEEMETEISRRPIYNGDGYNYGGEYVVSIDGLSLEVGGRFDIAKLIAAAPKMNTVLVQIVGDRLRKAIEVEGTKVTIQIPAKEYNEVLKLLEDQA